MSTLKQLKVFIAVAEYKNMSQAGKKLYISQPTISQVIHDLEDEYEVTLFDRHPKRLVITQAGQVFLKNAQQIVSIHENLEQSMKQMHSMRPLRIGATHTIGDCLLSPIISQLREIYPDLDITVCLDNTHNIQEHFIHNELDIALVEGIIAKDEIITKPVTGDNLRIICSKNHPFAQKKALTVEDLYNQNFIVREKGSGTRSIFENLMLQYHIPYRITWECGSSIAILNAVKNNLGISFLSECYLNEYMWKDEIVLLPIENVDLSRSFFICYHKDHPVTSQMEQFMECISSPL